MSAHHAAHTVRLLAIDDDLALSLLLAAVLAVGSVAALLLWERAAAADVVAEAETVLRAAGKG